MFLLENHPIISILLSIMLINGLYNFSYIVSKNKFFSFLNNYGINTSIIFFFIIVNLITILTYNFFLIFGINKFYLQVVCVFFILIGFYKPMYLRVFFKNMFKVNSKIQFLIFLILFFYFLLSLMPVSDPDTLDYHLTFPYYLLKKGVFSFEPWWIHSQLAGAGEALIALAMSIKSFQFSGIMQYFSLLLIVIIVANFNFEKIKIDQKTRNIVILCILCIPSFLFLVFTMKPTLFSIGTNFLAFLLAVFILPNEANKKYSLYIYSIIIFLILCSTQFKFSFFLTAGMIWLLSTYEMKKKKLLLNSISICFLLFFFIVLPREYYEYKNLSQNIIQNFFNPAIDSYIGESFSSSLKHGPGNSRYSFYWLFFPIRQGVISPSMITETVGISVLIFILNLSLVKIEVRKVAIIFCIYFILAIKFGQPVGRFFIEPFMWAIFTSLLYLNYKKNFFLRAFEKIVVVNSIGILLILLMTIYSFIPGLFSIENYKKILRKNADGYSVYEWANEILPENSVLITTHRAQAFSKNEFISSDYRLYATNQESVNYFLNIISKKKPTHILYLDHTMNKGDAHSKIWSNDIFYSCRGELLAHGKDIGRKVGRNPINIYNEKYDAYIYKIDFDKNSNCIKE
jgi:hypothetical protein